MGPLSGIKIIELAGIGPGPMCAMLLADMGATVLRIDRVSPVDQGNRRPLKYDLRLRNRASIALDLKQPGAVRFVLKLVRQADALTEGFRPGVTERMGLGPETCFQHNPGLVYGRMTGWGQTGPLSSAVGHDINYIALSGALDAIGRQGQPPTPPLNLLGDYAGGSLYLALGLLAAIIEAKNSGKGQVVDASILDGTLSLMTSIYGLRGAGLMNLERGTNLTDSGAYYYDVYQCADGRWLAVGAIEGRFHAKLLELLQIDASVLGNQKDRANWPRARQILADRIKTRARDEWCALLEGTDACVSPVLNMDEAPAHRHLKERGAFVEVDGVIQPAPAPRFSRTALGTPTPPREVSRRTTDEALAAWVTDNEIEALRAEGILSQ